MSLEQQVANLVEASNNLTSAVDKKIVEIDAKVDEATSAVPQTVFDMFDQKFYVDENSGSDSNSGSSSSPFKTLGKAVSSTPFGGKTSIVMKSDLTNIYGWSNWTGLARKNQVITISNGKSIYVDLNGYQYIIKTTQYNGWTGTNEVNPSLDKVIGVAANGFFDMYNGAIKLLPQPGDEGKNLYFHTIHSSVFNNDSSRTQLSQISIDSTILDVGLFGLDNWGSMGFDCHMRNVTLTGTGKIKRTCNNAIADEITVKQQNVSSSWEQ